MVLFLSIFITLVISCGGGSGSGETEPVSSPYNLEIAKVSVRDTELKFLLVKIGSPDRALLMFPGGDGSCHFWRSEDAPCNRNGIDIGEGIKVSYNFLARNILSFANSRNLVVLVDVPDDVKNRFPGGNPKLIASSYRVSENHVEDIKALMNYLESNYGIREFYLIGTSRGTLSVAYLSGKLSSLAGLILTATLSSDPNFSAYCPGGANNFVDCTGFRRADSRILFLHHKLDGCLSSDYLAARDIYNSLKADYKEFITVEGGTNLSSNPCKALTYHGFYGRDSEVIGKILDWIGSP